MTVAAPCKRRYFSCVDNPFERYDLDPRDGVAAITQRLKELAEDAESEAERAAIRQAWEELTLHPARRRMAAFFAHPETRRPLGMPPSLPRLRDRALVRVEDLGLRELAARPSVLLALGLAVATSSDDEDVVSIDADPVLRGEP